MDREVGAAVTAGVVVPYVSASALSTIVESVRVLIDVCFSWKLVATAPAAAAVEIAETVARYAHSQLIIGLLYSRDDQLEARRHGSGSRGRGNSRNRGDSRNRRGVSILLLSHTNLSDASWMQLEARRHGGDSGSRGRGDSRNRRDVR